MKLIYKTKKWQDGDIYFEAINNYIRKYFNDNNLIVIKDDISNTAFYRNFKIGCKRYNNKIEEINKKYKLDEDEEYWYFMLLEEDEYNKNYTLAEILEELEKTFVESEVN